MSNENQNQNVECEEEKMAKVNNIANNGLTIVENYDKLFEQIKKAKTVDETRNLVVSVKDFIFV